MKTRNRPSEIYQRLPARHIPAFERLMRARSVTVDSARQWLQCRGCSASRAAVGRCLKRFRDDDRLGGFCPEATGANDRQRRMNIRSWINRLSGPELAAVALFTGTLAHAKGEN